MTTYNFIQPFMIMVMFDLLSSWYQKVEDIIVMSGIPLMEILASIYYTHFRPVFPFYTPLKTSENQRFSGSIERNIGLKWANKALINMATV